MAQTHTMPSCVISYVTGSTITSLSTSSLLTMNVASMPILVLCGKIVIYSLTLSFHSTSFPLPATYGGHMELSAFAHMTRCNVKVIQPSLIYVIEWHTFSLSSLLDSSLSHLHPDDTIYVVYVLLPSLLPLPCKGDRSRAPGDSSENYNYEIWLQPTSRRFLRELDEAPRGNNLHYILQCPCVPASVTRV